MPRYTLETNDHRFEADVLKSDLPVIVDFYAPWCGPCQSLAPVLEALADQYQGRVKVVKIDVQDNPIVARAMGVRGIPALAVFKNGEVLETAVGGPPLARLQQMADRAEAA